MLHTCHARRRRDLIASLAVLVASSFASTVQAATPEDICQIGRAAAVTKFTSCTGKAVTRFTPFATYGPFRAAVGKCLAKYETTWAKLQIRANGSGNSCDAPRFVDNGDGTTTDRLTGLQWEQKTNLDTVVTPADPHDADNTYTWSAGGLGATAADGTVFTSFLQSLNGGCFAGQCDWRLPTRDELLTIMTPAIPSCTDLCIDPLLGPTVGFYFWTASTLVPSPAYAWTVGFFQGPVFIDAKTSALSVRAVRNTL